MKPTSEIIEALRLAAKNLRGGAFHSWGHHGACNCGNLVQALTQFSKEEILRFAHTGTGEWTELAAEYCSGTQTPLALIFQQLERSGLTPTDIHHIEYLSDREVLNHLPGGFRWLKRNMREDAIVYFETFANLLEERLLADININMEQLFPKLEMKLQSVESVF